VYFNSMETFWWYYCKIFSISCHSQSNNNVCIRFNTWNWFFFYNICQIIIFHFQTFYLLRIYLFYAEYQRAHFTIFIIYLLWKLENCFMGYNIFFKLIFSTHLQSTWCWFFPLFILFQTYKTMGFINCLHTIFFDNSSRTDINWFYSENITMSRIFDDHILKTRLNNFTLVQFVLHVKSYVLTRLHIHRLTLHVWYIQRRRMIYKFILAPIYLVALLFPLRKRPI